MEPAWDRVAPYAVEPIVGIGLETLGEFVRRWRHTSGMSQRELAARCHMNQSTISRLEHGKLRSFRLLRLAHVIGVLHDPLGGDRPRLTRWS